MGEKEPQAISTRGVRSLLWIRVRRRAVGNSYSSRVMSPRMSWAIVGDGGGGAGLLRGRRLWSVMYVRRAKGWCPRWASRPW